MLPVALFPSDPFSPRDVDDAFAAEHRAARAQGFDVAVFDGSRLESGDVAGAVRRVPEGGAAPLLHRGWMLRPEHYAALAAALAARGRALVVDPDAYVEAHWYPRGHAHFADLAPPASWSVGDDLDAAADACATLPPGAALVKDYVKSAKHRWDEACFIPDARDRDAVKRVCAALREDRAEVFQGGFVFRRALALRRAGVDARGRAVFDERRMFFAGGALLRPEAYADLDAWPELLPAVTAAARRFASAFVSIDVAFVEGGGWRVIEAGDGGVSGLPAGWSEEAFWADLARRALVASRSGRAP